MDSIHHSPPKATTPPERLQQADSPTALPSHSTDTLETATEQNIPPPIDAAIERRILRRLDFTFLPMLNVLFIVSFADRSNIGNAKIAGMNRDLELTGNRYNMVSLRETVLSMECGKCWGKLKVVLEAG